MAAKRRELAEGYGCKFAEGADGQSWIVPPGPFIKSPAQPNITPSINMSSGPRTGTSCRPSSRTTESGRRSSTPSRSIFKVFRFAWIREGDFPVAEKAAPKCWPARFAELSRPSRITWSTRSSNSTPAEGGLVRDSEGELHAQRQGEGVEVQLLDVARGGLSAEGSVIVQAPRVRRM